MAACERSGKRPPPDSQAHALARAALATWLTPTTYTGISINETAATATSAGFSSSAPPPATVSPHVSKQRQQQRPQQGDEARRDYLRHCLARSAIAARSVGRAVKKATSSGGGFATAGESTASALSAAGALPPAVAEEESLCLFLLGEVDRVVAEAEAEDRVAGDAASAATHVPRAQLLLGLGLTPHPDTSAAPAASVGAVDAFLTAALKHRLADAASLRAVRAVACILFQRQGPTKPRRRQRRPLEALTTEDRDSGQGKEAADVEKDELGEDEKKGGVDGRNEETDDDSAAATAKEVAAAFPVLPGWSAATMLER